MGLFLTTYLDGQFIHPDSNPLFFHCFLRPGNITSSPWFLVLRSPIAYWASSVTVWLFVGVFSLLPGSWWYPASVIQMWKPRPSSYPPVLSLYLQEFSLLQVLEPFVAVRRCPIVLCFLQMDHISPCTSTLLTLVIFLVFLPQLSLTSFSRCLP